MAPTILIFGNIGTEIFLGSQHYEIVVLGEEGQTTWRTRCEVCRTVVFAQSRGGKLPTARRCQAHRVRGAHPAEIPSAAAQEMEVRKAVTRCKVGMVGVRDFLPLPENVSRETEAPANGGLTGAIAASDSPSADFVDELVGTEAELVMDGGGFDVASLSAELAELAPDEAEEDITPRPTSHVVWQQRLQMFHQSGMWLPDGWGPRPGQAGCLVPQEVIEGFRR